MSTWTPQNDDPTLTLAAIRWYAMSIEKLAMDLYLTNKDQYPVVRAVLSAAFLELGKLRGYCNENGARPEKGAAGSGRLEDVTIQAETHLSGKVPRPQPKSVSAEEQQEDDGCGPGYVNCNGVCMPECDDIREY